MSTDGKVRLETADGWAPETVKPGKGEESELEFLEEEAARHGRTAEGGGF